MSKIILSTTASIESGSQQGQPRGLVPFLCLAVGISCTPVFFTLIRAGTGAATGVGFAVGALVGGTNAAIVLAAATGTGEGTLLSTKFSLSFIGTMVVAGTLGVIGTAVLAASVGGTGGVGTDDWPSTGGMLLLSRVGSHIVSLTGAGLPRT